MLAAATEYLRQAGEPVPEVRSESLIVAGHQPELFHPGVWVKNFALNGLGRAHGLTPVNLVVDNDTNKSSLLKIPAGLNVPPAHIQSLPFDHWASEVPYEERTVHNEEQFASLAERALPYFRDWPYQPLLLDFWKEVLQQARRTPLLGERLAAARRTWERSWGCHNLEIPVSAVCRTAPFAWFATHLLSELPHFHTTYNAVVHDYRRQNDIHSRNHPVPDLAQQADWLETPFWGWRTGQERRGRLLARLQANRIELRVGGEDWPALPLPAREPQQSVAAFQELELRGLKIRSRALSNTLFARLFLGDLFIHGIGGGKYDELTDEICRRFYGVEPPRFLVLSATLLLPLPRPQVTPEDVKRLEAANCVICNYNPQRHFAPTAKPERELTCQQGRRSLPGSLPLGRSARGASTICGNSTNSCGPACISRRNRPGSGWSAGVRKCANGSCWSGATMRFACTPRRVCGGSALPFLPVSLRSIKAHPAMGQMGQMDERLIWDDRDHKSHKSKKVPSVP